MGVAWSAFEPLPWIRGTEGGVEIALPVPAEHLTLLPPAAELRDDRPCEDLALTPNDFDLLAALGVSTSQKIARLVGGSVSMAAEPGGPTVATLVATSQDVLVLEVSGAQTRVRKSRWLSRRSTPCTRSSRSRAGAASPWLPAIWASQLTPRTASSLAASTKRRSGTDRLATLGK